MSEQAGYEGYQQDSQPQQTGEQQQQTGENPAWQELYGVLPESLRPIVAPVLQKWEQGTQQQFQQNAERMRAYEPYQELIDAGIPPDRIEQALAVAQLIDTDPRGFLQQMQTFFPSEEPQQQQQQESEGYTFEEQPFQLDNDPNFRQIKEQQDLIAQVLTAQLEQERANEEDQLLDQELTRLQNQYGEFDENYVFGLALNGVELEDAVQKYFNLVEGIRSAPRADSQIPNIVAPGGGMPSERIDPAEMTNEQRKAYVLNYLAQAHNQGAT
jgi:hypothetical protein